MSPRKDLFRYGQSGCLSVKIMLICFLYESSTCVVEVIRGTCY